MPSTNGENAKWSDDGCSKWEVYGRAVSPEGDAACFGSRGTMMLISSQHSALDANCMKLKGLKSDGGMFQQTDQVLLNSARRSYYESEGELHIANSQFSRTGSLGEVAFRFYVKGSDEYKKDWQLEGNLCDTQEVFKQQMDGRDAVSTTT